MLEDDSDSPPLVRPKTERAPAPKRPLAATATTSAAAGAASDDSDGALRRPTPARASKRPPTAAPSAAAGAQSDDSDGPLRRPTPARSSAAAAAPSPERQAKRQRRSSPPTASTGPGPDVTRGGRKWRTLEHHGVLFPPEYVPCRVPLMYDGKPIVLAPEAEEVAMLYASMKHRPCFQAPVFQKNFFADWTAVLDRCMPGHRIAALGRCNFDAMVAHVEAERAKKKAMTKEEKKAAKAAADEREKKYKFALVDGVQQPVGNFRVEPPSLFQGRGAHPLSGKIKRRVQPEDVIINCSQGAPIPPPPRAVVGGGAARPQGGVAGGVPVGGDQGREVRAAGRLLHHQGALGHGEVRPRKGAVLQDRRCARVVPEDVAQREGGGAAAGRRHLLHRQVGAACGQREGRRRGGHGGVPVAAVRARHRRPPPRVCCALRLSGQGQRAVQERRRGGAGGGGAGAAVPGGEGGGPAAVRPHLARRAQRALQGVHAGAECQGVPHVQRVVHHGPRAARAPLPARLVAGREARVLRGGQHQGGRAVQPPAQRRRAARQADGEAVAGAGAAGGVDRAV